MGGFHLIILPFQDPTCNLQDFKQSWNLKLGPSVAINVCKAQEKIEGGEEEKFGKGNYSVRKLIIQFNIIIWLKILEFIPTRVLSENIP